MRVLVIKTEVVVGGGDKVNHSMRILFKRINNVRAFYKYKSHCVCYLFGQCPRLTEAVQSINHLDVEISCAWCHKLFNTDKVIRTEEDLIKYIDAINNTGFPSVPPIEDNRKIPVERKGPE